jgi:serine/threonine-protein kinase
MAPEQARGRKVDHRTDIYAVGVLLYTALTGVMPFERETPQNTLLALLTEEAPPPRQLEPSIPVELELIIQKAMAKEAEDRYPWIVQLSQALAPFDPTHVAGVEATLASASAAQAQPPPATAATPAVVQAPAPAQPAPAQPAPAQPIAAPLGDNAQQVAAARSWIVGTFALGAPATFFALLLAAGGLLHTVDVDLEVTTWLVTALVLLLAIGPATGVAIRHVSTQVWGNSVATMKLARRVRAPMVAAGATYAVGAIALHLVLFIALEDEAWPLGETILAALAGVAGLIGLLAARGRA